jgi:hypothetical protein
MLIDIATGKRIARVPHAAEFETMRKRLTVEQFDAMVDRINELIDRDGREVATAGWLPGSDWSGTPFDSIYTQAAKRNYDMSAMFFGMLVWYTIMHRPERWGSGRYERDGVEIGSRTYFRLKDLSD